jgi:hypothetical protein
MRGVQRRLLLFIAGQGGEQARAIRFAMMVCFVAVFSGVLAAYALSFTLSQQHAVVGGILWGCMIAILEGMIAASLSSRAGRGRLGVFLSRVGFIIAFAFAVAHVGVLGVFQNAVDGHLAAQHRKDLEEGSNRVETEYASGLTAENARFHAALASENAALDAAQKQIDAAESRRREAGQRVVLVAGKRRLWTNEDGYPFYTTTPELAQARSEEGHLAAEVVELKQRLAPDVATKRGAVAELRTQHAAEVARLQRKRDQGLEEVARREAPKGLLARLEALNAVGRSSFTARAAIWLLASLLFFVELTPILVKATERVRSSVHVRDAVDRELVELLRTPHVRRVVRSVLQTDVVCAVRQELRSNLRVASRSEAEGMARIDARIDARDISTREERESSRNDRLQDRQTPARRPPAQCVRPEHGEDRAHHGEPLRDQREGDGGSKHHHADVVPIRNHQGHQGS